MNYKILVIGSKGQLGSEIHSIHQNYSNIHKLSFSFVDKEELDLLDEDYLLDHFIFNKYNYIINCAAYTAVDKAEEDEHLAYRLNTDVPGMLAHLAKKSHAKFIHVSTDYVFDGKNHKPYSESDSTTPSSVYGKTKLDGELEIKKSNAPAAIIRTSWLYSSFGNNFVKTMIRLGKERDNLNVVFDQVGTPTYAKDLAKAILDMIAYDLTNNIIQKPEVYHFSNEGVCSWYDFALEIMKVKNISCTIHPIESKEFPTAAKRPFYSVLNKAKIKNHYPNITIPHWKESLENCLTLI